MEGLTGLICEDWPAFSDSHTASIPQGYRSWDLHKNPRFTMQSTDGKQLGLATHKNNLAPLCLQKCITVMKGASQHHSGVSKQVWLSPRRARLTSLEVSEPGVMGLCLDNACLSPLSFERLPVCEAYLVGEESCPGLMWSQEWCFLNTVSSLCVAVGLTLGYLKPLWISFLTGISYLSRCS